MNLAVLSSSGMQPSANDDFWGGTHPLPRDLVCKSISKTAYQRKAFFFPFISSIANGQGMFEKVFCIYMDGFVCACHSCYEFHCVLYNCYPDASQCSQDLIAYTDGSVTKDEKNDPPLPHPEKGCSMTMEAVTHALSWIPLWDVSQATHAIILTVSELTTTKKREMTSPDWHEKMSGIHFWRLL